MRAAVPRYVDLYFDPSYKLYQTHAQRISTEPRVPMFEGFTMPPLTLDPERNAMYKQVQCRPTAVHSGDTGDCDAEQLVLDAFKRYSTPKQRVSGEDLSETAAVAFTRAFLEWQQDMKTEAAIARLRFADRFEFPSLWETAEMVQLLEEKLALATGTAVTVPATDPDLKKPRCTASQYSSLLAESRIAHLEGLARARQQKPKRRRDADARLYEEYVKVTTAGEKDDPEVDNPEEELEVIAPPKPSEVFQKILYLPNAEEQKQLLLFELQGRHNQYTKDFLEEAWIKNDLFEAAAKWKDTSKHQLRDVFQELNALSPDAWF